MDYHLLLVGLSAEAQELIRALTQSSGFIVKNCDTGVEATNILALQRPTDISNRPNKGNGVDLVIVDQDLSDMSGLTWLAMTRQTETAKNLPILVLGPKNSPESNLVQAFDCGADDFIPMPCPAPEFAARIRAVLRRYFNREENSELSLELGPIHLDIAGRRCLVRGKAVSLRPREFELLELLLRKAGRTLSRPYLLDVLWDMDGAANTRAVDVGVSRLRQALGPRAGRWIETVERYGYRFRSPGTFP